MSDTDFVDKQTIIVAAWLNDVNAAAYRANSGMPGVTAPMYRTALEKFAEQVFPEDFGAAGDGVTDDTVAVNLALATGLVVRGLKGSIYAVTGDITLPDAVDLRDISFKQLAPNDASRRTLKKLAGSGPIRMSHVKVDRNGATTDGSIADAAGIWLANVDDIVLEDVVVTGDSKGTGILITAANRVKVVRPYVHDMSWSAAVDPGSEQLVGVWFVNCSQVEVVEPTIRNLTGFIGANPERAIQTDGLDFSGCNIFNIIGGCIENCGEGVDISGTVGNRRFSVTNLLLLDIDSWGFKCANSASDGVVANCIARDCGLGGFVVSGPSSGGLPECKNISFSNCKAINTGSNGHWAANNPTGFSITTGATNPLLPHGVIFDRCEAIDYNTPATMAYGFRSEPSLTYASVRLNRRVNCYVENPLTAPNLQRIGEVNCSLRQGAGQALPDATFVVLEPSTTVQDPYEMGIVANTAVPIALTSSAGVFTDVTTDLNDAGAGDVLMPLLVNDALYIGNSDVLNIVKLNVAVAPGAGTLLLEYWNGAAWASVNGALNNRGDAITLTDGTNSMVNTGINNLRMTAIPAAWVKNTVNGSERYWLRWRVTVQLTGAPALTQGWIARDMLVRHAGLYEIFGQVDIDAAANGSRQLRPLLNGATTLIPGRTAINFQNNSTTGQSRFNFPFELRKGDLIAFEARQDSGGPLAVGGNATYMGIALRSGA